MLIEEVPEETSEKRESREGDDKEDSVFSNGVSDRDALRSHGSVGENDSVIVLCVFV